MPTSSSDARAIRQNIVEVDNIATVALCVLNNLNLAVAVIDPGGQVLFENAAFGKLFGAEAWTTEFLDCIGPVADRPNRPAPPREITRRDGRIFSVETTALPQGLVVTAEDISERVAEQVRAAELARTDPLTLLGNRLMFRESLTALIQNRDQAPNVSAVLTVDLNRFKAINDSLGASVGDAVLRVAGDRVRSAINRGDIAARFGADEFGIVQIGQPQPQSAEALANRLVDLLGRSYIVQGHLINIGASIGIALIPVDGKDCDQILKSADLALNRARQEEHSGYRFFETAMDEQMQARRSLEIDLRRALALREFALVYQAQLNLEAKQISGFEALLRWHNPKRGLVSPADFIPLAEEIGLIVPIGEWVIRTACREAANWPQPLGIAVNVSAVQFGSPSLVSTILSALAESGLDPRRLELEITESVLLGDHRAALDVLHKVRAMGVRVSMDDFGTGYSSLSYLRSFPFDKIKIDQSFVRGPPDDPSGMAIVRVIAGLGRTLGMTTVAEGVETEEQLVRIAADGCTHVQGYLISRPLPPERIGEFLTSQTESAVALAIVELGSSTAKNRKA
jgi:diguanylate cyclase (GGDEF)-like protein